MKFKHRYRLSDKIRSQPRESIYRLIHDAIFNTLCNNFYKWVRRLQRRPQIVYPKRKLNTEDGDISNLVAWLRWRLWLRWKIYSQRMTNKSRALFHGSFAYRSLRNHLQFVLFFFSLHVYANYFNIKHWYSFSLSHTVKSWHWEKMNY